MNERPHHTFDTDRFNAIRWSLYIGSAVIVASIASIRYLTQEAVQDDLSLSPTTVANDMPDDSFNSDLQLTPTPQP